MGVESKVLICPEGHEVPCERWNYARDFSDGDRDAMTLQPLHESGLYCLECDKAYGFSKLKEPEPAQPKRQ